ncbi:unnamed protein product, partial [Allacma fusca]
MKDRVFDIVIFGASGCTGRFLIEELVKYQGRNPRENFTWAVAGQYMHELESMLQEISTVTEKDCTQTDKIIADAMNIESLRKMSAKCKVVINCVGPFRFFGENLVKACLAERTDLIDASGEAQYHLKMQLLYSKEAEERNIYIISSCGFASIPADCGTALMQKEFPGDLNSVEIFYEINDYSKKALQANVASLISCIHIAANLREWDNLEKKVLSGSKFDYKYRVKNRIIHYNNDVASWCLINFQCDASVIRRSQHFLYQTENKRPLQATSYVKLPSFIATLFNLLLILAFTGLCQFKIGRLLLEKFPKICTLGHIDPNKRISGKYLNSVRFKFTIVGRGWDNRFMGTLNQHSEPPNFTRRIEVSGYNPFYAGSAIMLIQSALTVLNEKDKMPGRGGVLPPGVAFAGTTLVKRLND